MEGKKHPRLLKEWLKTRGFEHKKNDRVTDKLYQLLYLFMSYKLTQILFFRQTKLIIFYTPDIFN